MFKKIKPFIIPVLIPLAVGGLSALLTKDNMSIYDEIKRPPLSPPMIVFPITWSILYVLMGISSGLVCQKYKEQSEDVLDALLTYALTLFMNFFWTILFFNMKSFLFAFIWLLIMLGLILKNIFQYRKVDKLAANLQWPYFIWTTFAAYLNFGIYWLNR